VIESAGFLETITAFQRAVAEAPAADLPALIDQAERITTFARQRLSTVDRAEGCSTMASRAVPRPRLRTCAEPDGALNAPPPAPRPVAGEGYLTIIELAAYAKVSTRTLRRFIKASPPLPHYRNGPRAPLQFKASEYDAWRNRSRVTVSSASVDEAELETLERWFTRKTQR
jgi:hypothetical protein